MKTEIISRVAQIIEQQRYGGREGTPAKDRDADADRINLSKDAEAIANTQADAFDKDRMAKVERLKSLVNEGKYRMDQPVIDQIAHNIAKMFL